MCRKLRIEHTSERIRDKIAASKRKGLWVGGIVPLGYATNERKSEPVYAAAGLEPALQDKVVLRPAGATIAAFLSTSAPALPAPPKLLGEQRAAMQRLWNQ